MARCSAGIDMERLDAAALGNGAVYLFLAALVA